MSRTKLAASDTNTSNFFERLSVYEKKYSTWIFIMGQRIKKSISIKHLKFQELNILRLISKVFPRQPKFTSTDLISSVI